MKLCKKSAAGHGEYWHNIFWKFAASYMIVLIVPIVFVSALTYNQYNRVLREKVGESTINMLTQMQDVIDVRMGELQQLPVQIRKSPRLMSILMAQNLSRFNSYQIYQGIRELDSYRDLNDFIDDLFICLPEADKIITTGSMMDMDTFFSNIHRYDNTPGHEIKDKIAKLKGIGVWPAQPVRKGTNSHSTSLITYIRPVFLDDDGNGSIKLIITIRENTIQRLMNKALNGYQGYMYILDEKGQTIVHMGDDKPFESRLFALLAQLDSSRSESFIAKLDDQEILITHIQSPQTKWSYISVIPAHQIFAEVNRIRDLTIKTILIALIIGVILAIYFSYSNYSPVQKLLNILFKGDHHSAKNRFRNEWDAIEKQILITMDSKNILEEQIRNQRSAFKDNFIQKLLKNDTLNQRSIHSMMNFLKIEPLHGPFSVIVFSINNHQALASMNSRDTMELFQFIICNVMEEMCQVIGKGYAARMEDDKVVVLISFNSTDAAANHVHMKEIAARASQFFQKHFEFKVTVGLGKIYSHPADIKCSYGEASLALEYKIIRGSDSIIDFNEIKIIHGFINYYSMDDERMIIDCLKRGDLEAIRQVLNGIIEKLRNNSPSLKQIQCIFFEIISTAAQVVDKLGLTGYGAELVNDRIVSLLNSETVDELYHQIIEFYSDVCSYITGRKESRNHQLAADIIQYVDDNCNNKDLSLTMVADSFHISASYLSRFFKDHFGYNFSEYLQKRRIEVSKELLKNSSKTVNHIANEIGYSNVHSFINIFKKYEGVTPGQFRDIGLR